ncbi:MAG: AzlD domain-containing protein [Paracoccaceae bacterium]|uniref:AzlD domain-containing protein n=1 Tax=Candidatus Salinivivens marinus TaxID=3381703 RepID=UPI0026C98A4B
MIWFVMILTGLINLIFRISMFSGIRNIHLPLSLNRYVVYVPTSVLSAIIASSLISFNGQEVLYEAEKLVAASIAVIFAYLTKSVSATLVAGLITIWIM